MGNDADAERASPANRRDPRDTTLRGWSRRRVLARALPATVATAAAPAVTATTPTSAARGDSHPAQAAVAWGQRTKLAPSDVEANALFGSSTAVASDGGTAVVGAVRDDGVGSAYVFERAAGAWRQQAKLTPSDGETDDNFGQSVGLSSDGTTAVVGARRDENENGVPAGSAYAFKREAGGEWRETATLAPSDGDSNDRFGGSVALAGNGAVAVVGAPDEDPNGDAAGSAYAFERTDEGWREQTKLVPSDGAAGDEFGSSIGIADDGTTAVVGAARDERAEGDATGSAYVFERADGVWRQQAKLTPSDEAVGGGFGGSVGVTGDGKTAVVGASLDDDPNGDRAGSAYAFERADGAWRQRAKLTPSDGDDLDYFGRSVGLADDGSTVVVGAVRDEDPNGFESGSAYAFERTDEGWRQQAKLTAGDGDSRDSFGSSVSVADDGATALLAAPVDEDPNGSYAGSTYVFDRSTTDAGTSTGDETATRTATTESTTTRREGTTTTEQATPTTTERTRGEETATRTATAAPDATSEDAAGTASATTAVGEQAGDGEGSTPGFGALSTVASASLLAAGRLAWKRRRSDEDLD